MGEIADMMLDGTLCECCGAYMDGDGDGVPRYCSKECARNRGSESIGRPSHPNGPSILKTNCPQCKKRVKLTGLNDHLRAVHGEAP